MSVLIKGMEMPQSCRGCHFCGGQANMDYGVCAWCRVDGKAHDAYARQDCPLIPVPEPHGRLGDLDRLEQMFIDIDNAPYSGFDGTEPFYSAEDAAQIIRLAPTIIEAEEVE